MSFNVRSGARASEDTLIYHITTDAAKKYLQNKFNLIRDAGKKKGINMPDINITMFNVEIGRKFLPFMLILPMDVLEKNQYEDENISSIFLPSKDDEGVRFQKPYFDMLHAYAFNKYDKQAFRSPDWKNKAKVMGRKAGAAIIYASPKIESFGNSAGQKVVMLIDPIRLFHDMLVNNNLPKQKFKIWLPEWKKIDDGSYDFTVERFIDKSKGVDKNSLYAQMLRKVNGN